MVGEWTVQGSTVCSCHLTHKIAAPRSISLPLFTRNKKIIVAKKWTRWKDKFAVSKFWKHKFAEKTSSVYGQNSILSRPWIILLGTLP